MTTLNIALCDLDSDYILRFANYLMTKINIGVHIFTTPEGFFSDETDFDVTLLTEEFQEIAGFRPKGTVGHKYILTEDSSKEEIDYIYKFQAVDNILDVIEELNEANRRNVGRRVSNGKSKLAGVYSPIDHELQLPFSMALGQSYRTEGKVLFLDLEEISIMPKLIGRNCERNLMDLLYLINTNEGTNVDLSEYVRSFMGFDYIEPFLNPNEISEIDENTWDMLFNMLEQTEYSVVVILFGRAINGFSKSIERLHKLIVLGRPGDYFKKGQEIFLDYLDRISLQVPVENIILPMSAGNLSDGTYQLEELLQGNLGVFVKKLMTENQKQVVENYA